MFCGNDIYSLETRGSSTMRSTPTLPMVRGRQLCIPTVQVPVRKHPYCKVVRFVCQSRNRPQCIEIRIRTSVPWIETSLGPRARNESSPYSCYHSRPKLLTRIWHLNYCIDVFFFWRSANLVFFLSDMLPSFITLPTFKRCF